MNSESYPFIPRPYRSHWLRRVGRWCLRKLKLRKHPAMLVVKQSCPDLYRLANKVPMSFAVDAKGNVVELLIQFQNIKDNDLSFLADLSELELLRLLYCPNLTNDTLKYLAWTSKLRSVYLEGMCISAFGLRYLRGHEGLIAISLDDTHVGAATLEDLRSIPDDDDEMREIVETAGFSYLKSFPKLKELHLMGCKFVGDSSMAGIAQARGLEVLMAPQIGVTDQGLRHLHGHPNLEHVCLLGTPTTLEGLLSLRDQLQPGCRVSPL